MNGVHCVQRTELLISLAFRSSDVTNGERTLSFHTDERVAENRIFCGAIASVFSSIRHDETDRKILNFSSGFRLKRNYRTINFSQFFAGEFSRIGHFD